MWRTGQPLQILDFLPENATDMSADTSVLIGDQFYWSSSTGVVTLGGGPTDPVHHSAYAVSDDGTVVVGGYNNEELNGSDAYHWTQVTGIDSIGRLPWSGDPRAESGASARAVSADGSVIVGESSADPEPGDPTFSSRAFRWTEETGMVDIGGSFSGANGVTPNGNVIVGAMSRGPGSVESVASVWDFVHGMRSLEAMLINNGVDFGDRRLQGAYAISENGRVIVGTARNSLGNHEAFVVLLDADEIELNPIFGDYNDDGTVNAADYTVWRDQFGLLVEPGTGPDANNNGFVDAFDRLIWQENFGDTSLESVSLPVPEPRAIGLAIVVVIIASARRDYHGP
jgi:probable HAF family extracellular repeat protein